MEFCNQQIGGTKQEWWNDYGENNDFWSKKPRDGEDYWTYGSFVVNSSVSILLQNYVYVHFWSKMHFSIMAAFLYALLCLTIFIILF